MIGVICVSLSRILSQRTSEAPREERQYERVRCCWTDGPTRNSFGAVGNERAASDASTRASDDRTGVFAVLPQQSARDSFSSQDLSICDCGATRRVPANSLSGAVSDAAVAKGEPMHTGTAALPSTCGGSTLRSRVRRDFPPIAYLRLTLTHRKTGQQGQRRPCVSHT